MIAWLLDLIWPRRCEVCGRPADRPGRHVCSDCLMRLDFVETDGLCRKCGRAAAELKGEFLCQECREHHPHFDRVASALRFDGEARNLVNAFKFKRALHLRDDLVDWMEGMARARFKIAKIDLVTAIPSTLGHRWIRGYNQCDILARQLAKRLDVPYAPSVLRRIGSPRKQGGLNEEDRRQNVVGTFDVRRPDLVDGRTVLVVDDIFTTGSTLSECARVLKEAGCRKVWCQTIARTERG